MTWICPKCYCEREPEWNWERIQADEAIRVPTCPDCGSVMVEGDTCPLCGEGMPKGKDVCVCCWGELVPKLEDAARSVAVKGTPRHTMWSVIEAVASTMEDRLWRKEWEK